VPERLSISEPVRLYMGTDLIAAFTRESNLYPNKLKCKKISGLLVWMGKVWKANIKDSWLTDLTTVTPIFSQIVSRNHFEAIWQSGTSMITQNKKQSGRLFIVDPIDKHFVQKFKTVYSLKRELCSDEGMMPQRGLLKFMTYNQGKM
jgi:hypothetical protein